MSVAIRTATRIQDQDDVNVTVGAGIDEYALCWDNDTAKFVARQVTGVYLLATGATTGATSQAQTFTSGVVTPFDAPAADGVAAWQVRTANKTTAVLTVDTTNSRVGIGTTVLGGATDAIFTVRAPALTHNSNTITYLAAFNRVASDTASWYLGSENSAAPFNAILATNNANLKLGYDLDATFTPVVFMGGYNGDLTRRGMVGIGTTAPGSLLHGLLTSAAINAVTNVVTIGHDTSGTAANGFGAGLLYQLESSTTAAQSAARIQALWYEATHATRKADLVLTAYDTAEREGLRIRGAGSAPAIGFLGATPAARIAHVADPAGGATVDAEARSAINSILATLETFGFHATS